MNLSLSLLSSPSPLSLSLSLSSLGSLALSLSLSLWTLCLWLCEMFFEYQFQSPSPFLSSDCWNIQLQSNFLCRVRGNVTSLWSCFWRDVSSSSCTQNELWCILGHSIIKKNSLLASATLKRRSPALTLAHLVYMLLWLCSQWHTNTYCFLQYAICDCMYYTARADCTGYWIP